MKKWSPTTRSGMARGGLGDRADRQGAGVCGEDRPGTGDGIEVGEDRLLRDEVLDRGLDDEVGRAPRHRGPAPPSGRPVARPPMRPRLHPPGRASGPAAAGRRGRARGRDPSRRVADRRCAPASRPRGRPGRCRRPSSRHRRSATCRQAWLMRRPCPWPRSIRWPSGVWCDMWPTLPSCRSSIVDPGSAERPTSRQTGLNASNGWRHARQ